MITRRQRAQHTTQTNAPRAQVRKQKLLEQQRARAKILSALKADSATPKGKGGAKAPPKAKPAADDAKLDSEAEKDYQKFIALKQVWAGLAPLWVGSGRFVSPPPRVWGSFCFPISTYG
jgi:hypothetical protein